MLGKCTISCAAVRGVAIYSTCCPVRSQWWCAGSTTIRIIPTRPCSRMPTEGGWRVMPGVLTITTCIHDKLARLQAYITTLVAPPLASKLYVDTGPVVERVHAKYAGLGWFGKNTCLLNTQLGSWLFLGELILTIPLEYDRPTPDHCGTCTRCLDACPTEAFLAPYVLDARRCISYLTIELKGAIPEALRPHMGQHIFGCDICQDVCPWNRKRHFTTDPGLQPLPQQVQPELADLAQLTPAAFKQRFRGTALERTKRRGLLRNVCVAMGNSGNADFIPLLETLLDDAEALVREHAAWALARLRERHIHPPRHACRPYFMNSSMNMSELVSRMRSRYTFPCR